MCVPALLCKQLTYVCLCCVCVSVSLYLNPNLIACRVECEGGEMALDIAPLAGRVLLVLSGAVEHALLPGSGGSTGCDTVFVRAWCC